MTDADLIERVLLERDAADLVGDMSLGCLLDHVAERLLLLSQIADMNEAKF